MNFIDMIERENILLSVKGSCKKQVLSDLAEHLASVEQLDERAVFETLLEREKLGSTGIGKGVALPHGKVDKLDRIIGLFARLEQPVDFEAVDGQQVDLVFLLLASESVGSDHLKALSAVARTVREDSNLQFLRNCEDADKILHFLQQPPATNAA